MPTLNQGEFIERSIVSLVSQLTPEDIFVVVDGGSTDRTPAILEKYVNQITHIHVVPGSSQAQALEYGFTNHQAKFACYLNSDDLLLPGAVESALSILNQSEYSAVYSHRLFIDPQDGLQNTWVLPPHNSYLMKRWDYIPQETCFWRYDKMMQVGGINAELQFAVDYDLFVRLMQQGTFYRANEFWGAFRVHEDSKTQRQIGLGQKEVRAIQLRLGIKSKLWDRVLGGLLRRFVEWRASRWMQDKSFSAQHEDRVHKSVTADILLTPPPSSQ